MAGRNSTISSPAKTFVSTRTIGVNGTVRNPTEVLTLEESDGDPAALEDQLAKMAAENFLEYLDIKTTHPNPDYYSCVLFLLRQAKFINLPAQVLYTEKEFPIVVMTLKGTDPSLPSILLLSHMDVVPAYEEEWKYPPFESKVEQEYPMKIYGRGTQGTKSVGIQYLEAIRRLQWDQQKLRRTVHVIFTPSGQASGHNGMKNFVLTDEYKALNVGFALDVGMPSPTRSYKVYYGERAEWRFEVHCPVGEERMQRNTTAPEKLRYMIDKLMDFRAEQKARLADPSVRETDVTSLNLTMIKSHLQHIQKLEVQATDLSPLYTGDVIVTFNCYLSPDTDHEEFEAMLVRWYHESGEGTTIEYPEKTPKIRYSRLDNDNPYWVAFRTACKTHSSTRVNLETEILPGASDARWIRDCGTPAINFSPINETEVRVHGNNEYISLVTFLRGIEIYEHIIKELGNMVPENYVPDKPFNVPTFNSQEESPKKRTKSMMERLSTGSIEMYFRVVKALVSFRRHKTSSTANGTQANGEPNTRTVALNEVPEIVVSAEIETEDTNGRSEISSEEREGQFCSARVKTELKPFNLAEIEEYIDEVISTSIETVEEEARMSERADEVD